MMPRVVVMLIAMPIVGRIYNAVSPRIMIGLGILFIALGAWDMSHFTLQSGQGDIVFAIVTQGAGFACLFVPLSTTALAAIPVTGWPTRRAQLAVPAGRRFDRPRRQRDASHALR